MRARFRASRQLTRQLPAQPLADGAAHDELLVTGRQPGHLLREHGHALLPRAGHARDVRAPEHPLGAEGFVELSDVAVDVAMRIGLARVAGSAGGLESHVRMLGSGYEVWQIRPGGVGPAEVIDDQLEAAMALRDGADDLEEAGAEQRDGELRTLGGGP